VVDGSAADAAQQILKLTDGGAWAVIDYVGSSKTVQLGVDSVTKGGKVIVVGLFGGDITVSTPFFPLRAMGIQGSYVGSLPEMKELLALVRAQGLPPIPLRTRRLDDVGGVLDELRAGKVIGRVVLTPAG
jgi:D-arabinose 1-dehydrogenase-like Zn-dependent alcohol dehydrogenase